VRVILYAPVVRLLGVRWLGNWVIGKLGRTSAL
jgi:hypothetical protein